MVAQIKLLIITLNKFPIKLLLLLIFLTIILRFYNIHDFFFYHVDEEILYLTAKRILVEHRAQLIGFPIPGGINLGPLFYYIISFFYLLSNLNPLNLTYWSAVISIFNVVLVFLVGKELFNSKVALLASLTYSISYIVNVYSHLFTGLTITPTLALLTYFFINKLIIKKSRLYLFLLAIVLLVCVQNEGSSFSLIVLVILLFFIYKIVISKKNLLIIALIFIIFHIPLLIFNFRHDNYVFKSFANFFDNDEIANNKNYDLEILTNSIQTIPNAYSRFLFPNGSKNISEQILPCPDLVNSREVIPTNFTFIFSLLTLLLFIFLSLKLKSQVGPKIISIHIVVMFAGLVLYNVFLSGYFFEWVFVIIFPAFSYIFAYTVLQFKNIKFLKIPILILLVTFILINLRYLFDTNNKYGLKSKLDAVNYATEFIANKNFYLDSLGSCYANGYLSLFWSKGKFPVDSYAHDMFSSTIIKNKEKAEMTIVISTPSQIESNNFYKKYYDYKMRSSHSKTFEGTEVLVIEDNFDFR